MNVDEDIKASLNLMKMIFFLIIYIHFYACIWWLICKDAHSKWIPQVDMESDDFYQIYGKPIATKYNFSIFTAVQVLLGGDIMPQDGLQTTIAAIGTMLGAIINANIFSELVVIVESMGRAEKKFQSKFSSINTALINLNLDRVLA